MQSHPSGAASSPVQSDAPGAARAAGLRYVHDSMPGITRERVRGGSAGFAYRDAHGKPVREPDTLVRIRALAIPPAWSEVWICAAPDGHLQATGRDARGRKQYRYHALWRSVRDDVKYERMIHFGQALPGIRRALDSALRRTGLPREKVLATIVNLLQTTMIRIGNPEYARTNDSFGLTTLCAHHVRIDGGAVQFRFRGKSGVFHSITVNDRRMARIIERMRELPGQELFHYQDGDGQLHPLGSSDVNDYLRALTGQDYTAKDFRTWAGSVLAARALRAAGPFENVTQAKKNLTRAIEAVAEKLGNSPAICRKCYVHPAVVEAYLEGTLEAQLDQSTGAAPGEDAHGLHPDEAALLDLLQQRMQSPPPK